MNTGLIFAAALGGAAAGFAFGLEACAKADTVGPGDPGTTPCILSIDWTTQRQAPAVYPADAVEQLLTPPVVDSPGITTTTLPHPPGGGGSWLPPAPVPLPAAGLMLGAAVIGLGALAARRRR